MTSDMLPVFCKHCKKEIFWLAEYCPFCNLCVGCGNPENSDKCTCYKFDSDWEDSDWE
jgi:hypothetical protein